MDSTPERNGGENLNQAWSRFAGLLEGVQDRLQVRDKARRLQELAVQHPVQAFVIAMVISLCSIPIGIFILFASISVCVTFFSFLFFEGFLLVFGTVALGGSLIVFAIIALILSAVLLGLISTVIGGRRVVIYFQANRDTWRAYTQHLYVNCMRWVETLAATAQGRAVTRDPTGENQENHNREDSRPHDD